MKIIVLGGTGFIGQQVCEQLAAAGHSVTVPTRRIDAARPVQILPGLNVMACNVHDPAQLTALTAGHDVLVNLVAVLHGDAQRFAQVHVQLPRSIVAACKATGVPRIVHISALGAALTAPSLYQRSKAQGEAVLTASGLQVAILRPSVVFGAQDKLLNLFARLQTWAPVLPLAGANTQFQPVWVQDVAQAVVQLATHSSYEISSWLRSSLLGKSHNTFENANLLEACGPDLLSLRELVALAGRCIGKQRPILPLPLPLARLQAWLMERLPGEPLMSRDNLDSMQVANIASGQYPGLTALGITPSSIYAIAPTYLGAARTLDQYRRHVTQYL